jgi:RNA polymerase sigma-70 factor, ECF subfamily
VIDQDELVAALPGLLRYAQSLTRDLNQAEDLVQETVTRALERADTFRGESSLRTWLHRVMYHLMVDRRRRDREVVVGDLADEDTRAVLHAWTEDDYTVDASVVVTRAETRAELEDALTRLPFIYRTAVVLHDAVGLTSPEVADVQQIGLPAAKQRLRRGRMLLVSALASGAERRERLKGVPMRCWDARARVSDYLDDELPLGERAELEHHLESCPTCPPLYAGLVGTRQALSGSWRDPDTVVPDRVLERLRPREG